MTDHSKIFTGFRALGYVTNHIPVALRVHKKQRETFVITCVGRAFHIYKCSTLGIVSVSNRHEDEITALAADDYLVFTASGPVVRSFAQKGLQIKCTYEGHKHKVHLLLPLANHLISVDTRSCLKVWDISTAGEYLELPFDNGSFEITAIMHPYTYLNKILLGSKQGAMQLWNLKKSQLVFAFPGWNSPVTILQQAPAVDVVAVGLANGHVLLHNLKYDETIVTFKQEWGPVTAVSFRTDGPAVMCSGSTLGHIALWDLDEQKLLCQMRQAHHGPVTGLICLPGEPLMVTTSPDNNLKEWIFDMPDGAGRLLRYRSGHSQPPTKIRFHGNNGKDILSAGEDSTLKSFSVVHESNDRNLGRASLNKKRSTKNKDDAFTMTPIVDFASESCHQSDWDSIAACHASSHLVTTWNYLKGGMGQHMLTPKWVSEQQLISAEAMCVTITSCGNFVVIGYSTGHVDLYNIQSGIYRGTYGDRAHCGEVRGVAVDALNQLVCTGGADGLVKFWKFKAKQLLSEIQLDSQVAHIRLHRESNMLAVALDNLQVHIVDLDVRRVVRVFSGHTRNVTDMTFSCDGRWLITASLDTTIKVWDLPSATLIDCFCTDSPVTSLDLSPTSDFLVTTHLGDLGLYLWSNMTLYKHVALRPLPPDYEPAELLLPSTSGQSRGLLEDTREEDEAAGSYLSCGQLSEELVTLAMLPTSRWLNLLNLDVIKQRNKPKEPPKVPKGAPFFLPTLPGLQPKFAPIAVDENQDEASKIKLAALQPQSEFTQQLVHCHKSTNYLPLIEMLKSMSPSAIDIEIRNLSPENGGSLELLQGFLKCLTYGLQRNRDFEVLQAYLALFLKIHSEVIAKEPSLEDCLQSVQKAQADTWDKLEDKFNQTLCLSNYLKSAVLS